MNIDKPNDPVLLEYYHTKQAINTGTAMVLIALLIGIFTYNRTAILTALALLLINMIWPLFFKPVSRIWIGFSILIGTFMSKVVLTIIFFLMLTPVGVTRKLLGADAMQLKKWKEGTSSVFNFQQHIYQPDDLEKPF